MVMNIKKEKAIEALINGENITDTAKLADVNRKTIYAWLADEEFKAELDRQTQLIKKSGEQRLMSKLETYIQELEKIALTSKNEKNKMDSLQYLINRNLGTPTNKNQDITEHKNNDSIDSDKLQNEFDKFKLKKVE